MPRPEANATLPAPSWNPLTLAVLTALWIAAFANWPAMARAVGLAGNGLAPRCTLHRRLRPDGGRSHGGAGGAIAWRWTLKPIASLLLIAAAVGAHFMGAYGVVIDPTMMVNVLQTDPREDPRPVEPAAAAERAACWRPCRCWWLWRRPYAAATFVPQLGRNLRHILIALAVDRAIVWPLFAELSATMRNHKSLRYLINPLNSLFALAVVADEGQARPKGPPQRSASTPGSQCRPPGSKPPLVMFVIGETARADHFSLNGYARPTNPELALGRC
jgi:lipid A ethanolaminephosphotransferase